MRKTYVGPVIADIMDNVSNDTVQLLDEYLQEVSSEHYSRDELAQGLFVMGLDLRRTNRSTRETDKITDVVEEVLAEQPSWITNSIQQNSIPNGFASAAEQGEIEYVDFSGEEVDHEWLMHPGNDFFEVLVRQYYPMICGRYSVQTASEYTQENVGAARDIALLIIGSTSTAVPILIPITAIFCLKLVEENIDDVCERYEPY